jgi:hypothetical protein
MATQIQTLEIPPDQDAWKLFVFRKARDIVPAQTLVNDLKRSIETITSKASSALEALIRAGEIETALADAASPDEVTWTRITDALAGLACGRSDDLGHLLAVLEQASTTDDLRCSFPEGFSYYGLNPLDFGDIARSALPLKQPHAAVVGVRSVGSTLAALVSVTFRMLGIQSERMTVRPQGEPYDRITTLSAQQFAWIQRMLKSGSEFFIVDEGPGFSGSTLLSVAQALEQASVPRGLITILCSRPINQRWNSGSELTNYRFFATGYGKRVPAEADRHIGGGLWRMMVYPEAAQWPPCWTDLERIKHLSVDCSSIFKFEGFGRFGALAQSQAAILADAGFSPALLSFADGFAQYSLVKGNPLRRQDLNHDLISRMAKYCAFRAQHLTASPSSPQCLLNMLQVNLEIEFACKSPLRELQLVLPVYPDSRMMPHEWIARSDGEIKKTDSVGHGEGHQIPGPVDIAWDLAGAIVEWDMSPAESEFFLQQYQRFVGDDASNRIHDYLILYCSYRMAHCRMGAACLRNSGDGTALWSEYQRHSQHLRQLLTMS